MPTQHPYRLISASAVALAIATLAACGKTEKPMDAPAPSPPVSSAPAPATTMGEKVDDTMVTTKVKAALMADEAVKGMDISVTTVGGEVQLTGVVDTQAQQDRAVEVAKAVEGAQRVQNGMTVKK